MSDLAVWGDAELVTMLVSRLDGVGARASASKGGGKKDAVSP